MPPKKTKKGVTTRCPAGSRRNAKGKCAQKPKVVTNNAVCDAIRCPKGKIINPATGKCVLRTGAIGKKLVEAIAVVKSVEKKIEHIRQDPRVPESIKQDIGNLVSKDDQKRNAAERNIAEEVKKNASVQEYIVKYASYLEKLKPYVPYLLAAGSFAGGMFLLCTGLDGRALNLARKTGNLQVKLPLAHATGQMMSTAQTLRNIVNSAQTKTEGIWLGAHLAYPKYERLDELLSILSRPGDKQFALLKESEMLLTTLKCQNEPKSFLYIKKFLHLLKMWENQLRKKGQSVDGVLSWIGPFSRIGTSCPK